MPRNPPTPDQQRPRRLPTPGMAAMASPAPGPADLVHRLMFLDCPAYLDRDGGERCGLPAEVRCRFIIRSAGGPPDSAMIRCPAGHWFNGPIESLTPATEPARGAGLLRRAPTTGDSYHDPLFERPDLVEHDYYRFRHQPHGW
jgi:hypothetical protein